MNKEEYSRALDNLIDLIVTTPLEAWVERGDDFGAVIREQPILIPMDVHNRRYITLLHDNLPLYDIRMQRIIQYRDRLMLLSQKRKQNRIEAVLKAFLD